MCWIYEQSITTLGTANGSRTASHPSKSVLTDIKALTRYCTSSRHSSWWTTYALRRPFQGGAVAWRWLLLLLLLLRWRRVALFKLKTLCIYSGALMPCCPTFMDGLNLCPQMRQINPDSADIISCSTLWHRRNSQRPHFLQQLQRHLFFSPALLDPDRQAGERLERRPRLYIPKLHSHTFQQGRVTQVRTVNPEWRNMFEYVPSVPSTFDLRYNKLFIMWIGSWKVLWDFLRDDVSF